MAYIESVFILKILIPGLKKEAIAQGMDSLFTVNKAAEKRKDPNKLVENEEDKMLDGAPVDEEKKKSNKRRDEDESDDESEAGEEDDFDANKRHEQRADVHEYDESDTSDSQSINGANDKTVLEAGTDDEGFEEAGATQTTTEEEIVEEETVEEDEEMLQEKMIEMADQANENRQSAVVDLDELIADYEFDAEKSLYCRVTLSVSCLFIIYLMKCDSFNVYYFSQQVPLSMKKVDMSSALRRWVSKAVVRHVPNIKRAFVVPPKTENDVALIRTEGVNIEAMFAHSHTLDINRLYSNDVHAISRYYGVEAASRVLVNEIRNVFKVYGIDVDPRHLTLVASYMTSGGGYRSFSRMGMADCTSPLQQMTFETATAFLQKAVLQGLNRA